MPKFTSEAKEAQWWHEQRDRLTKEAEAALARGELKLRRLPPSTAVAGPAQNLTIRRRARSESRPGPCV